MRQIVLPPSDTAADAASANPGGELAVSELCLGAMPFGTTVDEKTSFAILDRFAEAGGTFVDTANNYAFWINGTQGGESETVVGAWLADRGVRDRMVIATKCGARPRHPGGGLEDMEGLSRDVVRQAIAGSLERLGTDRVDLFYPHVDDRSVPLEATVRALAELVTEGSVRALGCSNHAVWRMERARAIAEREGLPGFRAVQQRYSYLAPRTEVPLPEGGHRHASPETLDWLTDRGLPLVAYTSLLFGAYDRTDKELSPAYNHPGTAARLATVREVATECGAKPGQVVLAWLRAHRPTVIPLIGVSSVAQLDDALASLDLELSQDQHDRLNDAGRS
ncbi:aldo/keto reductase [Allostreptomyces psammosilenae]|uniref:Aryl-alcohol dehydrogenase-like predicted oxidoreductase n=1 Tax=Allostreptomyces psammosilenae TaxID=1892865 RepID=A0A852ZRY2_9ACTN|nr:aldo/keto reductase [Allostreptomyces psammosilenae]NYI03614.1 aryl-alcohol dehydrogenase-like predicted oxidoreductase [Allostreptomyces psammosilenae]